MTTKLTRPVTRETADRDPSFGRTLMIRLDDGGRTLRLWVKGRRRKLTLTYADIYRFALAAEAKAIMQEKQRAREERRRLARRR